MDKKLILLFLLFLTTLTCSSKIEKPIPEKQLEGWAGNPNNPNEKPFDYFYMNHAARASQKSINQKNGEMMKATCIDAASTNFKREFIEFMLEESLRPSLCTSIEEKNSSNYYPKEVAIYTNPINDIHLINATDGPCISRKLLVKEYSKRKK